MENETLYVFREFLGGGLWIFKNKQARDRAVKYFLNDCEKDDYDLCLDDYEVSDLKISTLKDFIKDYNSYRY